MLSILSEMTDREMGAFFGRIVIVTAITLYAGQFVVRAFRKKNAPPPPPPPSNERQ